MVYTKLQILCRNFDIKKKFVEGLLNYVNPSRNFDWTCSHFIVINWLLKVDRNFCMYSHSYQYYLVLPLKIPPSNIKGPPHFLGRFHFKLPAFSQWKAHGPLNGSLQYFVHKCAAKYLQLCVCHLEC